MPLARRPFAAPLAATLVAVLATLALAVLHPAAAAAAPAQDAPTGVDTGAATDTIEPGVDDTADPSALADASAADDANGSITLRVPTVDDEPSQSVLIIVLLTLLSIAPALLILLTSFTRIAIVLTLTRNALGLQGVPPNQVIVGLALFLSFFVMAPTLGQMNEEALQPMLNGDIDQGQAYDRAVVPLRAFMLEQVGDDELELFLSQASDTRPETPDDVPLAALVPAFVLSEIRTAFLIGFVIFIPFLVIDLVVSSSLMSMGMMMLPPIIVSLPFKILLFVLVDGWTLVVKSVLESFSG